MSAKWSRIFPGQAWQVAQARHYVAGLLEGEHPGLINDAVLVVGELAANAVRHTRSGWYRGWFLVIVGFNDELIRIQVIDQGGDTEPRLREHVSAVEEGGRGLSMVAASAKDWGVKNLAKGECSVWADLPRVPAG
ncbi:ATP-binding protein [Streptomyces sp. NPDC091281]|uniref:ATP-binding protein n=1 Tax=Streptomyces sp. NPDC091281 TaxID=3365985 RepID=UPI00382E33B8